MNKLSLEDLGGGAFELKGRVDLSNADHTLAAGQKQFEHYEGITVDLEQADCASTVGMAVLLEWSTWSRASGKKISYTNVSSRLSDMAKLNDVEEMLQLAEAIS